MKLHAILWLAGLSSYCFQAAPTELCEHFFTALEDVPHVVLSVTTGDFVSIWDNAEYSGCEIEFETNDALRAGTPIPDFDAIQDSEMHRLGWRIAQEIRADGPGSGFFGLEKESVLCVVRWAQPAHIDDDGEIVQSETFSMKIQCRDQ
jgi:hypothetical protein